jgi:hypothetical protein
MEGIVDHRNDNHAGNRVKMHINHRINRPVQNTTMGWHLRIEWKDRPTSWYFFADIKDSNHVEVVEYAASKKLQYEPDFV